MQIGARGGTRTPDAHLRTVALYPLSYTGTTNKNRTPPHASTACAVGLTPHLSRHALVYVHQNPMGR